MNAKAMPDWWPLCPVCSGPIERIEWTAKPGADETLVRLICHGKQDWQIVPGHQAANGSMLLAAFAPRAA